MALLTVEHLHAGYGPIEVLKDISLEVNEGEIVTMIGANGAGKTTTLMTISGAVSARAGRIVFQGREIQNLPPHEIVRLGLCQSPEGRKIFPRLTVLENLELGAYTRNDKDGIIWPGTLAPYEVLIAPVKVPDDVSMKAAMELHDQLTAAGIDVLLDDRDCRAGVKFKDADLIGVPLRVVIGDRGLKEGKLEVKWRWEKDVQNVDLAGAAETLAGWIREERKDNARFKRRGE